MDSVAKPPLACHCPWGCGQFPTIEPLTRHLADAHDLDSRVVADGSLTVTVRFETNDIMTMIKAPLKQVTPVPEAFLHAWGDPLPVLSPVDTTGLQRSIQTVERLRLELLAEQAERDGEIDCPRCLGSGEIGVAGTAPWLDTAKPCPLCHGNCVLKVVRP